MKGAPAEASVGRGQLLKSPNSSRGAHKVSVFRLGLGVPFKGDGSRSYRTSRSALQAPEIPPKNNFHATILSQLAVGFRAKSLDGASLLRADSETSSTGMNSLRRLNITPTIECLQIIKDPMYLLDDNHNPVDAEFSLSVVDCEQCIVVESRGGSNSGRGVKRRNPDYNKLLSILFARLANAQVRLTRVVLDSAKVANLPLDERIAELDASYPIDLTKVDLDEFRKGLGRRVAEMHRDPAAKSGGNAQKRIRICIENPISPDRLVVAPGETHFLEKVPDGPPEQEETEREYLRSARRGQGAFRKALLDLYAGVCPVTGVSNPDLLIASHIKPWSTCTSKERLDPSNGILLSAMMDRLFDKGLISFDEDGRMLISPRVSANDAMRCGLNGIEPLSLSDKSREYLVYHRTIEFKRT